MKNNMGKDITKITSFAVICEACITYINQFFVGGNFRWQMLLSIFFSVSICLIYNLDLINKIDSETKARIPLVGNILTGILMARGSNYIYDLLSKLK